MKAIEFEEAVIGACMDSPELMTRAAERLSDDKFTGENATIFGAMADLFYAGKPIEVLTINETLAGDHLGTLRYLDGSLERLGANARGFENWVDVVNTAGQIRHINSMLTGYQGRVEDTDAALREITNVEEFVANIDIDLRGALGATTSRSGFVPIGAYVEEWKEVVNRRLAGEVVDRLPIGWPTFDSAFQGLPSPGLVVLAGLTSTGKTQLAIQMALQIARQIRDTGQDGCVGMISIEMTGSKVVERMACSDQEQDSTAIGRMSDLQAEMLFIAGDELSTLPFYIDDSDYITSRMIGYRAAALHSTHGPLRFLVVDYAELVGDERAESEELRVSGIYRRCTGIQKQLNCTLMLLSQYNRSVGSRQDKVGTNFDIRYSGAAEACAHMILHGYNPIQLKRQGIAVTPPPEMKMIDNMAYVMCGKNRGGKLGIIRLGWEPGGIFWSDPAIPRSIMAQSGFDKSEEDGWF